MQATKASKQQERSKLTLTWAVLAKHHQLLKSGRALFWMKPWGPHHLLMATRVSVEMQGVAQNPARRHSHRRRSSSPLLPKQQVPLPRHSRIRKLTSIHVLPPFKELVCFLLYYEVGPGKASSAKNAHSRAYHGALKAARKAELPETECKDARTCVALSDK